MKAARVGLLFLVGAGLGFALWNHGAIPQPDGHGFADQRTLLHVPNALNVLSNVVFLLVGWLGLGFLRRGPTRNPDGPFRPGAHTAFESLRERPAYVLFFVGVLLSTFGSGWYHLRPSTARLFWDRLPMAVAFSAFFAAMIAERISVYWSRMLLLPLVFTGVASVVLWKISEDGGRSDLRFYLFVQLFPVAALPLMILLFPARYSRGVEVLLAVLLYGGAKVLEHFDERVWEATTGVVSGHALKHVTAGIATYLVLDALKKRGRPRTRLEDLLDEDEDSGGRAEPSASSEGAPPSVR